ncbi:MAG: hypothetical protein RR640_04540, partial [Oscillospiraceae bacterium]
GPSGEIMMDYSIYDAKKAGFNKVIFVIKQENYQLFKEVIGDRISKKIDCDYVFQSLDNLPYGFNVPQGREKPWGTGHAVLSCLGVVDTPFVIINADDYYGSEAFEKLSCWIDKNDLETEKYPLKFAMAGYILQNTLTENGSVARGICNVSDDGFLINVTERTKILRKDKRVMFTQDDKIWEEIDPNSVVSMNCWCFTPQFLKELKEKFKLFLQKNDNPLKGEFMLPFAVQELIDENKCSVNVLTTKDSWFGVTYKEDKEKVINALAEKVKNEIYPVNLII